MNYLITESQYRSLIMELSPKSAGVQEFIEMVKETPGLLRHLHFKSFKALEEYIHDASYEDFSELKKEAEHFKKK